MIELMGLACFVAGIYSLWRAQGSLLKPDVLMWAGLGGFVLGFATRVVIDWN